MMTPFDPDQPANAPDWVVTLPTSGIHAIKSRLTLSMTPVADAPVFSGSGVPITPVARGTVLLMADLALDHLPDPNLSGARIALSPALPGDRLMLGDWRSDSGQGFTSASGRITGSYANGTLVLIGLAALAEYQGVLRSAAHAHDPTAEAQPRNIEVSVADSNPVQARVSPVATITLQPAPDAPDTLVAIVTLPADGAPGTAPPEEEGGNPGVAAPDAPAFQNVAGTVAPLADATPDSDSDLVTRTGSDGDDYLTTAGVDHIFALDGDDVIELAEGTVPNIFIDGGDGDDMIVLTEKAASLAPVSDEQITAIETISAVPLEIAAFVDMEAQSESFAILGGSGDDRLRGGRSDDLIHGGAGDDRIDGGAGDDALHGGSGDDRIDGGAGDDWISGGGGGDELTGGDGFDVFHFGESGDHAPDIITDFRPGDRIALTGSTYLQGLSNETLETGSWFWLGATARDGDTRILYDRESGYLIYASDDDAEGTAYVRIARFGEDDEDRDECSAAHLSYQDFLIV